MRICVTAKDIKVGIRRDSICCPVARALSRGLNKKVSVGTFDVMIDGNFFNLPERIQDWIADYDAGKKVKPTWFDV